MASEHNLCSRINPSKKGVIDRFLEKGRGVGEEEGRVDDEGKRGPGCLPETVRG